MIRLRPACAALAAASLLAACGSTWTSVGKPDYTPFEKQLEADLLTVLRATFGVDEVDVARRRRSYPANLAGVLPSPDPDPGIEARPGEKLFASSDWLDGSRTLSFERDDDTGGRVLLLEPDGRPNSALETLDTPADGGKPRQQLQRESSYFLGGGLAYRREILADVDAAGKVVEVAWPLATYKNDVTGVDLALQSFKTDFARSRIEFAVAHRHLGWTYSGVLEGVTVSRYSPTINPFDPLRTMNGKAAMRGKKGELLFTVEQLEGGGVVGRTYSFPDGVVLRIPNLGLEFWELSRNGVFLGEGRVLHLYGDRAMGQFTVQAPSTGKDVGVTIEAAYGGEKAPVPQVFDAERAKLQPDLGANLPAQLMRVVSGNGRAGFSNEPHTALASAEWQLPADVQTDGTRIYVSDRENHRVRVIEAGQVRTLVGNGDAGSLEGVGEAAQVNRPSGLALAADGTLYVSEQGGNCIDRVAPDGTMTRIAGDPEAGWVDGPGQAARFSTPCELALMGDRLLVADAANQRIRAIDLAQPGFPVTTIAGTGAIGRQDGPAASATFSRPYGMEVVGDTLYISEEGNRVIRALSPDGRVTTYAGTGEASAIDGPAASASFLSPLGMAKVREGLLVVDLGARRLRVVTPAGLVKTYAGNSVGNRSFVDANIYNEKSASFLAPFGATAFSYAEGDLVLVTGAQEHKIYQLQPWPVAAP